MNTSSTTPETTTNHASCPGIGMCNRADAEAFITALTGDVNTKVTFQTFNDADKRARSGRWFHGSIAEHWEQLVALNRAGHGIFVMINKGDGRGRAAKNVIELRAAFLDDDGRNAPVIFTGAGIAPFTSLPPAITVQSKAGQHHYFPLNPGEPRDRFPHVQGVLAAHFGTDPAIKDLPRVMRMPGFMHMKDPKNPILVRLVKADHARYSIDDLIAAYPAPDAPPEAVTDEAPLPSLEERIANARAYVAKVPGALEGYQGDKATFKVCAMLVRDFGLSEEEAFPILSEWNARCVPPWSEPQLREKLSNAMKYGSHATGSKAAGTTSQPDDRSWSFSDRRIRKVCVPILDRHFRLWRDERSGATRVFRVIDGEASLVTHETLLEKVLHDGLAQVVGEPPKLCLLPRSAEIWRATTTAIHQEPEPFVFADDDRLAYRRFSWKPEPQPYPAWEQFTKRLSDAPAFMAFIWSVFEPLNTGRQYLWLYGTGEDGKSVVLGVIKDIFGNAGAAVNAVNFSKENRFLFSSLLGKRVVVYPDCKKSMMVMGEIVRNITSGDPVPIEFKGKDLFTGVLKCKLLIASNELPILTGGNADKSRCLLVTVAASPIKDDPTWRGQLEEQLPGFLWACKEQYRLRCPLGGKIELSAESEALRDEVIADAESKFEEIFETYFIKNEEAELAARRLREILITAGVRSDQEVRDFKTWMLRSHQIKSRRTGSGLKYPGLVERIDPSRAPGEAPGSRP
jgi:hypothetical protein